MVFENSVTTEILQAFFVLHYQDAYLKMVSYGGLSLPQLYPKL